MIVLATGTQVQLVGNELVGDAIALVWLVGVTNAFNLLDNMDGLAATLAAIAFGFFAIDAVTVHSSHARPRLRARRRVRVRRLPARSTCGAKGRALVFMGDSGSLTLGFALAALGLASSWRVAGTTVATLVLPILILAVPILDTALVTVVRLLEGRPIYQGGRDHASHRLVRYGLSERRARAAAGADRDRHRRSRASPTTCSTTSAGRSSASCSPSRCSCSSRASSPTSSAAR